MDLYEYQGKELFKRFGIPVSEGRLATTPEEARAAAEELGGQVVVKAQVLTGGRGKAGGIKLADDPSEAEERAREILGLDIRGHVVRKLWIERASDIAKEYYLSLTFDRGAKKTLLMLTREGGIDIEEVAAARPEALARLHVDPLVGHQIGQAAEHGLLVGEQIPPVERAPHVPVGCVQHPHATQVKAATRLIPDATPDWSASPGFNAVVASQRTVRISVDCGWVPSRYP